MSAVVAAQNGAASLVPPPVENSPRSYVMNPVAGSASAETSGTWRTCTDLSMPGADCHGGRDKPGASPPPPPARENAPSQVVSLMYVLCASRYRRVPPTPTTPKGLAAGQSTDSWWLDRSDCRQSYAPASPVATNMETPASCAALNSASSASISLR